MTTYLFGESYVASALRRQDALNRAWLHALDCGKSPHGQPLRFRSPPPFQTRRKDPMNITINIRQIANGYVVSPGYQEGILGCDNVQVEEFFPDAETMMAELPRVAGQTLARQEERNRRYEEEIERHTAEKAAYGSGAKHPGPGAQRGFAAVRSFLGGHGERVAEQAEEEFVRSEPAMDTSGFGQRDDSFLGNQTDDDVQEAHARGEDDLPVEHPELHQERRDSED
jgi:hypothetical protein